MLPCVGPEPWALQRLDNTVWCFVVNGGMGSYSRPYISPKNSLHNPFLHSLLRTSLQGLDNNVGNLKGDLYKGYYKSTMREGLVGIWIYYTQRQCRNLNKKPWACIRVLYMNPTILVSQTQILRRRRLLLNKMITFFVNIVVVII